MSKIPRSFSRFGGPIVKPWKEKLTSLDTKGAMEYAVSRSQTSVSMQTMLDSGRGKFLGGEHGQDSKEKWKGCETRLLHSSTGRCLSVSHTELASCLCYHTGCVINPASWR